MLQAGKDDRLRIAILLADSGAKHDPSCAQKETQSGSTRLLDPVLFQLAIEGLAANTKRLGSLLTIATSL